ncbi:MAG TPA: tetratricopeptide repeat protein [Stellaceae bacterium]|nr:tetratricopeptide repeat protein [Stellaceae bacterium]
MSDIFREVDEELRRDNLMALWRRYQRTVIAAAAVVIAAAALWSGWRQYETHQREAAAARYVGAMDLARAGKDKDAADALAALGQTGSTSHALLARFEEAALRARAGDREGAVAAYHTLADDGAMDPLYRALARLLEAQNALEKDDPKTIIDRLAPLTDLKSPWSPMARELTALAQIKAGNTQEARKIYQSLADDPATPRAMRQRASDMLGAIPQ